MEKVTSKHVAWIDLENPSAKETASLVKKFMIHPLVAEELSIETFRPKLERFDDHIYLVLHFPIFDRKTNATLSREIDFVVFAYNLITVHYEEMPQLNEFQQLLIEDKTLREKTCGSSSGHLLYGIISKLFAISRKELEQIDMRIKKVQDKVFNGREYEVLRDIAQMKRDLLNFQKALKPQKTVLDSLAEHGKHFLGSNLAPYFNDIKGEYTQVWNTLEDLRETLDVLYETNVSLLSANSNEVMKVLTAFAAILLPLSLLSSMFGMNVLTPFDAEDPMSFWKISALMGSFVLIIYLYFKKRKWI